MTKHSTIWIMILLVALSTFNPAVSFHLPESTRFKRQYDYPTYGCNTCGGGYGYGNGLGSMFYGQYGGGYNNNYGGTNIGSVNVENVNE